MTKAPSHLLLKNISQVRGSPNLSAITNTPTRYIHHPRYPLSSLLSIIPTFITMEVPSSVKPVLTGGGTSAKTFRISEIPISLTKIQLMDIVGISIVHGNGNINTAILHCSMAPSPADQRRFLIATMTLSTIPPQLNVKHDAYLRSEITVGSGAAHISFDTHFFGLTPLNDGVSGAGYIVEYVPLCAMLAVFLNL